ncbi:MAG: T9SS type A sorting domain-containing protein [Bacteroidetes bacterium]|nr:T9SS type A sorting domain-containing protein [Bacteroidota bacterium]
MKKQFLSLFIFVVINILSFAQKPNNIWAYSAGGAAVDRGSCIITDKFGNVYYAGVYTSASISFGSITLNNAGNNDIFIGKNDIHGNVVWAKSVGGTGDDFVNSITVDSAGSIYLAGAFKSPSIIFGSSTLTNSGSDTRDIFIAKYDSSGNVLWAKSVGGSSEDVANSIKTDKVGNILITGSFQSASIALESYTLTNSGSNTRDIFIAKYDSTGAVIWAKSEAGVSHEEGSGITTDSYDNVFVIGYFNSTSFTIGATNLANNGSSDIFIAKYDSSGTALWAKCAGGTAMDFGTGIVADRLDNVCITGWFGSSQLIFGDDTLSNEGNFDVFITKYNSSGNELWTKSAGGSGGDVANTIFVDNYDNYDLLGSFSSDSIIFGNDTLIKAGGSDIFVVKYDSSGTALWAKSAGGTLDDNGYGIAIDKYNNEYITGLFKSPTIAFGSDILTDAGNGDGFIAKLSIADNNGPVCVGSTVSLSASPLSGATYSWTGLDGYTSLLQNPDILNTTDTITGVYFLTVSVGGIPVASGTTDVFIKFMPSAPVVTNNGPICVGDTLSLTASSDTVCTYSWTGPSGFTSNVQNPTVSLTATAAMVGSYSVSASLNGCTSSSATTSAVVDTIPLAFITPGGITSFCHGDSITLTSNIAYNYFWSDSSTNQTITVLDSGSYNVTVYNILGCSATSLSTKVTINDNPPIPTITAIGTIPFCHGDSVILTSDIANNYFWSDSSITQSISALDSGSYFVTVYNNFGCSATSSPTIITVYDNPAIPTITMIGDTLFSSIASTYQWYLNDLIVNGTDSIYLPLENGDYTVETTDSNGCAAISAIFNYVYVGINEPDKENSIKIFPNPTNSAFTITLTPDTKNICISNSIGQLVKTINVNGQKNLNIELSENGLYYLKIVTGSEVITKKIIVVK